MNDVDYESASEDEMINENEVINYFPITAPAKPFTSLRDALAHDESNGFNLIDHLPAANSEDFFEDTIVIINKCRTYVQQNSDFDLDALKSFLIKKDGDEQYFRPVLEDDAFLMYIDDLEDMKDSHVDSVIESEANKTRAWSCFYRAKASRSGHGPVFLEKILVRNLPDPNANPELLHIKTVAGEHAIGAVPCISCENEGWQL